MNLEASLLLLALLLLAGVLASKVSDRFGIPALLVFIVVGMLAGSEGPGGVYFDDAALAQHVGVVALVLILFSGGLDTDWPRVRPVLRHGVVLATLGVTLTAAVEGVVAHYLLRFSLLEGLLLGAIVSSTDAAAAFSILRAKSLELKGSLRPLLELESGSNDPMAVLLTVGMIQLITLPEATLGNMAVSFVVQLVVGAALGLGLGWGLVLLINRLKLGFEGLYPVLTLGMVLLIYGLTARLGGNGFLAVYLAGIVAGNRDFIHKRSLLRFHDGLAWLMQIAMFVTLGLLVFPSQLVPVAGVGLLLAGTLIFLARPLSIFLSLAGSRFSPREKAFLSWVGLRGAVPIILATYPLLADLPQAKLIFNIVFFVVLTSVLLQGTTVSSAARLLKVDAPSAPKPVYPIEFSPVSGFKSELKELSLPEGSPLAGRAIVELGLPVEFLIVLIARGSEFVVPGGATTLLEGDTLIALADRATFAQVQARAASKEPGENREAGRAQP